MYFFVCWKEWSCIQALGWRRSMLLGGGSMVDEEEGIHCMYVGCVVVFTCPWYTRDVPWTRRWWLQGWFPKPATKPSSLQEQHQWARQSFGKSPCGKGMLSWQAGFTNVNLVSVYYSSLQGQFITYSKDRAHHHVVMFSEGGFIGLGKGGVELFFRILNAATKSLSREIQTTMYHHHPLASFGFLFPSMYHLPRKPQQAFSGNAFLLWCFSCHEVLKRVVGGSIALQLFTDFLYRYSKHW